MQVQPLSCVHWLKCRDGEEERRGNSVLNRSEVDLAFALFSGALPQCTQVRCPLCGILCWPLCPAKMLRESMVQTPIKAVREDIHLIRRGKLLKGSIRTDHAANWPDPQQQSHSCHGQA